MQVAIELGADRVDDLDEGGEALQGVVLGLDRDDHAVRRDEAVDGQEPEGRRAVDDHPVVAVAHGALDERLAKRVLATDRGEQLDLGGGELQCRRRDVDPLGRGRDDDRLQGCVRIVEHVGDRLLDLAEVDPEPDREIGLGVHVHREDALPRARRARRRG